MKNSNSGSKLPIAIILAVIGVTLATAAIIAGVGMLSSDGGSGPVDDGECGNELTWSLGSDGTLVIDGTGKMFDWEFRSDVPWSEYVDSVLAVEIKEGVTSIGDSAFSNCRNLTAVSLPQGLVSIGDKAFHYCYALKNVDVPEGVVSIGEGAFRAGGLVNIALPESLGSIGAMAFQSCMALQKIYLSADVIGIGDNAFEFCESLRSVEVADENTHYFSESGVLFDSDKKTLLLYPAGKTDVSYTVPERVVSIADRAFEGCDILSELFVHEGVVDIGESAFADCEELTIHGLTGSAVYEYARENSVPFRSDGEIEIDDEDEKTTGTKKTIPTETIKEDGDRMTAAEKEELRRREEEQKRREEEERRQQKDEKDEAKTIPDDVVVPDDTTTDGKTVDSDSATANENEPVEDSETDVEAEENDVVEQGTEEETTNVTTPDTSIQEIPAEIVASGMCGDTLAWSLDSNGKLTVGGTGAMTSSPWSTAANSIKSVVIENGVTSICDSAFWCCYSLESADIADSVTSIGKSAFGGCLALTRLKLPAGITEIGDSVFWSCRALASVTVSDGVTRLGHNSFGMCTALTYVYIPNSVVSYDSPFLQSSNVTICASGDSAAAAYAREAGIKFEEK